MGSEMCIRDRRGYVRRSEYQWASYGGGVLEVYNLKGAVIDQFTVKAGR